MSKHILLFMLVLLTGCHGRENNSYKKEEQYYYFNNFKQYLLEIHGINIQHDENSIYILISGQSCNNCLIKQFQKINFINDNTKLKIIISGSFYDYTWEKFFNNLQKAVILYDKNAMAKSYDLGMLHSAVLFHVEKGHLKFYMSRQSNGVNEIVEYIRNS